jgi:hypothetical protein
MQKLVHAEFSLNWLTLESGWTEKQCALLIHVSFLMAESLVIFSFVVEPKTSKGLTRFCYWYIYTVKRQHF